MRTVTVNRDELLDRVRENRDKHRSVFEAAMDGYRKAAIEELDRAISDARSGRKIMRHLSLIEPVDKTKDYDRVIDMLEMSTDEEITLEQNEFACYVRDEWAWRDQFLAANSSYTAVE